ncbi:ATP-grasp domain-containing protein [Streptomyces sp. NPDC054841]
MSTSMICRREVMSWLVEPEKNKRLIVLRSDAPVEEWVEAARYIHHVAPVDAVFNFTEKDTEKTAAIGRALGLPTPSAQTYHLISHKLDMRRRLAEAGVDDTRARLVESARDVEELAALVGYPLICKPVQGVGSNGVSRIDSAAGVERALAWGGAALSSVPSDALMVEQFHGGSEFSVECLSEGGRHVVACVTQKIAEPDHFVELGHVLPAPLDDTDRKRIESVVLAMLDALGVTDGVTHTEVVDTGDAVRVIETHLRPAGDEIPYMLAEACGVDLIEALARQSAGLPALDAVAKQLAEADPHRCAAIWYRSPDVAGEVRAIDGLDEARAMPGVRDVSILRGVGEQLTALSGSSARSAYAWAVGASPDEALTRARDAVERLRFSVTPQSSPEA